MRIPPSTTSSVRIARASAFVAACGLVGVGAVTSAEPKGAEPKTPALHPMLILQEAHSGAVTQIAWSRDGKLLLTGALDDTARLFEVSTGSELRRFQGPVKPHPPHETATAALSPDGSLVVALSDGSDAVLSEAATGVEVRRFHGGSSPTTSVAFAAEGSAVVMGAQNGDVLFYAIGDGRAPRRVGEGSTSATTSLAVSSDGRVIYSANGATPVRRWNPAGAVVGTYPSTGGAITDLATSADGSVFVTGSSSGTLSVWSAKRMAAPTATASAGAGSVRDVDLSADGHRIAAVGGDGLVRLFEIDEAGALHPGRPAELVGIKGAQSVAFSPDARSLAVGGVDQAICVRSLVGEIAAERSITPRALSYRQLACSGDGGLIALSDAGNIVHVFSASSGAELARFHAVRGAFALAPDGRRVLVGESANRLTLRDAVDGTVVLAFEPSAEAIDSAAFTADGNTAIAGGDKGVVDVIDVASGRRIRSFQAHQGPILWLKASARGSRLLTISNDGGAAVWDLTTGGLVRRFPDAAWGQPGRSVDLSPNGTEIAFRSSATTVEIVAIAGAGAMTLPKAKSPPGTGHAQAITGLSFSPSGARVVTTSWDKSARVWNARTGALEARLLGHDDDVLDACFLADERFVLTSSADRTARLFEASSGRERCTLATFPADVGDAGPGDAWCVIDGEGRFDSGGRPSTVDAHFVDGLRTFALEDFADQFRDPGLLAKLLGQSKDPLRMLNGRVPLTPPPLVTTEAPTDGRPTVRITAENRGGGIGRIALDLNGRRVSDNVRGETFAPQAKSDTVDVDLSRDPRLLPGEENRVQATAYDESGLTRSRGRAVTFHAKGDPLPPQEIWAVVCGVGKFAGDALALRFPAKDAQDFAAALTLAAGCLVGPERFHLALLTSPSADGAHAATRENLRAAFADIKAKANDLLVVYLAGHGLVVGEERDRDYYYLSADAESFDLSDPATRDRSAVSGRELARWVRSVNAASGQVLFVDTCAAGQLGRSLRAFDDTSGSAREALGRLREDGGIFVLAGCASDRASYESSVYGQGLLTYALLLGMSCGCHFKDDVLVDVSLLMDFACAQVPRLARTMMLPDDRRQQPVRSSDGPSFVIGKLTDEGRAQVPLRQPRPVVVRSDFQRNSPPTDSLKLSKAVDAAVRDAPPDGTGAAPLAFVDTGQMAGAYRIAGRYNLLDARTKVTADVHVFRIPPKGEEVEVGRFEVRGAVDDVPGLAVAVAGRAVALIAALPR